MPSPYLAVTLQMTLMRPGRIGSMPLTALRMVPSANVSNPRALHSAVSRCTGRVAVAHCCATAPSEPCVRVGPAHGSSKPCWLADGVVVLGCCLLGAVPWQAAGV